MLGEYERLGAWPKEMRGGVLMIDELGMVCTRQVDALMAAAFEMGMDVRGIGDDAQLPEIGAGGTLRALADELPSVELSQVRRQPDPAVRRALSICARAAQESGMPAPRERGNVISAPTADGLREAAVANYLADASQVGFDRVLMLARTMRCVAISTNGPATGYATRSASATASCASVREGSQKATGWSHCETTHALTSRTGPPAPSPGSARTARWTSRSTAGAPSRSLSSICRQGTSTTGMR